MICKYYYGDYGDKEAAGNISSNTEASKSEWPLWEVFIRSKQGLDHKHVGSLHAADSRWPLKMPVMYIHADKKALAFG